MTLDAIGRSGLPLTEKKINKIKQICGSGAAGDQHVQHGARGLAGRLQPR